MPDNKSEKRVERLALEVLTLSRNTLAVELRFMDRALFRLGFQSGERPWFACDGRRLFFEPWYVLGQYKADPKNVNRDLLHLLLHLVYRHSYVSRGIIRLYWDLATDIAVEYTISAMGLECVYAKREGTQAEYIALLKAELPCLTAERIYAWLRRQNMTEAEARELRAKFVADEHSLWYGSDDPDALTLDTDAEEDWEDISKRMETELELLKKDEGSPLLQNLRDINRVKYNYTDFLRRFGVWGESLRLSEDEFDNNYYCYGLSLYGDLPLIEPLEYREQRRIREFVIAIDSSGSVKGEVVQSFIQHTHDILSRQDSFFTKVKIHILQCDDRIQEDALICSKEDFDEYLRHMEIKGLGKTDFRPVFEYVDTLIKKKELTELKGLIYFTDGRGVFPTKKPAYETAFILHRDDYSEPIVPSWAIHMSLSEEEVLGLGKR